MESRLPVEEIIPDILSELACAHELVIEAPPGAGKTTRIPLALLDADWLANRKILMLQPRRVAVRTCASFMAAQLGEQVGQTVGYRVRQESRIGGDTRIEIVTEGILTRMLQTDPSLSDVGLLIFDEFHERNLDADLGLALALQGRELFRNDGDPLKILIMSATLDGESVARLLGGAPRLRSEGRMYPVEIRYGRVIRQGEDIVEPCVRLLRELVADDGAGNILVFLPGQKEIRAVQRALVVPDHVEIMPLYGGMSLRDQQLAIAPVADGRRKIVLATNIAETSLTIEGVSTVVDSGLVRVALFDAVSGVTRLHTRRVSRASSVQRMGRAGRLGPGRCYRLWSSEQQDSLAAQAEPEILNSDLSGLALQLLAWGVDQPGELMWLDSPPEGQWQQALSLLVSLRAAVKTDTGWALTPRGELLSALPLDPRLANLLVQSAEWGELDTGCKLAALFAEQAPSYLNSVDVNGRLAMLETKNGHRDLSKWRKRVLDMSDHLSRQIQRLDVVARPRVDGDIVPLLLAYAWPDRIAQRQTAVDGIAEYLLANGRRALLGGSHDLSQADWLVIVDIGGSAGRTVDRIYLAAQLDPESLSDPLNYLLEEVHVLEWDERRDRLIAEVQERIGSIVISSRPSAELSVEQRARAVADLIQKRGLGILPWDDEILQWRARVELCRTQLGDQWPDLSDAGLLANLDQWLMPYLGSVRRTADLDRIDLKTIVRGLLPWPLSRELDVLVPDRLTVPSGSRIRLDYEQSPPVLAVKLQEMFQCQETPRLLNGALPVQVHLLSPAGRPLQVTQDLAGFWRTSYQEVKREMKGRYPKHPWPDDPLTAEPSRYTKNRQKNLDS